MSSIATKLNISGSNGDSLERFCMMYSDRTGGKSALVADCLAGGTILKETGLLDLILNLDKNVEYRTATNTAKTRMLLDELSELFGAASHKNVSPQVTKTESVTPSQTVATAPQQKTESPTLPRGRARIAPDLGQ
ncbi:hypothetical protein ACWU37_20915 (plasmid) [Photobacterium damselae subsp. damselae]|uniref:hypothetical protein n=1 Tax=Photobacterium damselae TaxID=38293 RepID=UPI001F19434C|nr:hypothetical protein [Photobacterium damselae]UKA12837.1 hypothetical protein IHC91_20825 [Photobacterium damselae subsp. damselae]